MTIDGLWIGNRNYWALEFVTTSNSSAVANSHTLQLIIARILCSQSSVSSPLV
jgi:hypothetical protein